MRVPGPKTSMTLQRATETEDSMGTYSFVWATVATIKGVLWAKDGNEVLEQNKTTVRVSHGFVGDTPSIIPTENDRLLDSSGNVYEILFVDRPQLKHIELKLLQRTT